jgi:hypothetical protein
VSRCAALDLLLEAWLGAGIVTNGNASLRWLAGDSPNLTEAREAIAALFAMESGPATLSHGCEPFLRRLR